MYFRLHENIFRMVVCAFQFFTSSLSLHIYLLIVHYVSRNVLPCNLSTPYLSCNCSLVTLLSVMSESINGNLLNVSAESLSGPSIHFILGPYSSNIRLQRSTNSVVKLSNVSFLWSVYTVIRCPKILYGSLLRFPLYPTVLVL